MLLEQHLQRQYVLTRTMMDARWGKSGKFFIFLPLVTESNELLDLCLHWLCQLWDELLDWASFICFGCLWCCLTVVICTLNVGLGWCWIAIWFGSSVIYRLMLKCNCNCWKPWRSILAQNLYSVPTKISTSVVNFLKHQRYRHACVTWVVSCVARNKSTVVKKYGAKFIHCHSREVYTLLFQWLKDRSTGHLL